ncbi:MAG: NDP-sugar synthase [Candidatus Eremiobacteraeota bacterium]|nr:NDP-sugar synthase [Candidatus Eremiobacteraeota bacterium]
MQAIVLVGGEGTRLRPLTYGTPKPMVPIVNVPFLARTMERLHEAGVRDVILPAGYMPHAITDYFGDGSRLGLRITYVIEDTPMGTAGAIKNVEQHIHEPFFVLNGDILTSLDLRAMMEYHHQKRGLGTLHLIRVEDPSAFGCVVHDPSGRISAFVEKPKRSEAPTDEVNAGTYLFEPEILDLIPSGRNVSIERETFPKILADGLALYAYTTNDYWMDIGRPENYLDAHRDILSGAMPLRLEPGITGNGASALQDVAVVPPIHVAAGAHVGAGAHLGPNVVLGPGCTIGERAVIKDSVLWDDVRVGEGARIDGSIIASGSSIGAGATISAGSVIGHHTEIAAGQVVEAGARIGPTAPLAQAT